MSLPLPVEPPVITTVTCYHWPPVIWLTADRAVVNQRGVGDRIGGLDLHVIGGKSDSDYISIYLRQIFVAVDGTNCINTLAVEYA